MSLILTFCTSGIDTAPLSIRTTTIRVPTRSTERYCGPKGCAYVSLCSFSEKWLKILFFSTPSSHEQQENVGRQEKDFG